MGCSCILVVFVTISVAAFTNGAPSESQNAKIHEHIPALLEKYQKMKEDIKELEETMVHFREYSKLIEEENTAPSDEEIAADNGAEGSAKEPEEPKLSPFERMRQMAAKWKAEGKQSHLHIVKPAHTEEDKAPEIVEQVIEEIPEGGNSTSENGTQFVAEIIEEIPEPEESSSTNGTESASASDLADSLVPAHQEPSVMQSALRQAIARLKARLAAEKAGKDPDEVVGPAPDMLTAGNSSAISNSTTEAKNETSESSPVVEAPPVPAKPEKPSADQLKEHKSLIDLLRSRINGPNNSLMDKLRARLKQPHSIQESLQKAKQEIEHSGVHVRKRRSLKRFSRRRREARLDRAEKRAKKLAARKKKRAERRKEIMNKRKERKIQREKAKALRIAERKASRMKKQAERTAKKALRKTQINREIYTKKSESFWVPVKEKEQENQ